MKKVIFENPPNKDAVASTGKPINISELLLLNKFTRSPDSFYEQECRKIAQESLRSKSSTWTHETIYFAKIEFEEDSNLFENDYELGSDIYSSLQYVSGQLDVDQTLNIALGRSLGDFSRYPCKHILGYYAIELLSLFGLNEGNFRIISMKLRITDSKESKYERETFVVSEVTKENKFKISLVVDSAIACFEDAKPQIAYKMLAAIKQNSYLYPQQEQSITLVHIMRREIVFCECKLPINYFEPWDSGHPEPLSIRFTTKRIMCDALMILEKLSIRLGAAGFKSCQTLVDKMKIYPPLLDNSTLLTKVFLTERARLDAAKKLLGSIGKKELLIDIKNRTRKRM